MITQFESMKESIEFVNELLQLMNQFLADRSSSEYSANGVNFVKSFAHALYEYVGMSQIQITQLTHNSWGNHLLNLFYQGKPLELRLFNTNFGNSDGELRLPYPEKFMHCDYDLIEKLQISLAKKYHQSPKSIINKSIVVCIASYRPCPAIRLSQVGLNPGMPSDIVKIIINAIDYRTILRLSECSRKFFLLSRPKIFFRFVSRGDLVGVKRILRAYPYLVSLYEEFEDLSGRIFKCTALQYAIWSGDKPLLKLIRAHLSDHEINNQTAEITDPAGVMARTVGRHYNFNEIYMAMYKVRCLSFYNHEIYRDLARAQKRLPAWIIYLWCDIGEYPAWHQLADKCSINMEAAENCRRDPRVLRLWYAKKQIYQAYPLMPSRRVRIDVPLTRGKEKYLTHFFDNRSFKNLFEDINAIQKLMGYQALFLADLNFHPVFTATLTELSKFSCYHKIGFDFTAAFVLNVLQELTQNGVNGEYIRQSYVVLELIYLLKNRDISMFNSSNTIDAVSESGDTAIAMAQRFFEGAQRDIVNNHPIDQASVKLAKNTMIFFRAKTPRDYPKWYLLESSCPTYAPSSNLTIM